MDGMLPHAKRCNKCGVMQLAQEYGRDQYRPDGRSDCCKACKRIYNRQYYANNREKCKEGNRKWRENNPGGCNESRRLWRHKNRVRLKEESRRYNIYYNHGITEEEYDNLMKSAGGMCSICQKNAAEHLDHCHDSGNIRGPLCARCNQGLGSFYDDPVVLDKAAAYLRKHAARIRGISKCV